MGSAAAHDFDYLEVLGEEGRQLPYRKLVDIVAAELTTLSDRVDDLEKSMGQSLINGGLLIAVAILLYFVADAPVAVVPAVLAAYSMRRVPSDLLLKRSSVIAIAALEERLSAGNFGVKWDQQRAGKRRRVRVFWRGDEQPAG